MKATTEQWFRWFYFNCDFGPADEDYRTELKKDFMRSMELEMPEGWEIED